MSISQTITTPPDAPSRSDPSTFSSKADAWVAWQEGQSAEINSWSNQANSLATTINGYKAGAEAAQAGAEAAQSAAQSARNAAEVAQGMAEAAANYKGEYNSGTTYALYDRVLYETNIWGSKQSGNVGNTPATGSAYWEIIINNEGSNSNSESTTSAVDITLTDSSAFIQNIKMTAENKTIILPDATTMTKGLVFFIVVVPGSEEFFIKPHGGQFIGKTESKNFFILLSDNSTAEGVWKMSSESDVIASDTFKVGETTIFESASVRYKFVTIAPLAEGEYIVCYSDGGNSSKGTACILEVSGSTITAGTPVVFSSGNIGSDGEVIALSATKAVICYSDSDNSAYGTACILDISGSTITVGSSVVFESASTLYTTAALLSSAKIIVCYRDGGNGNKGTACILEVSGSTITAGTPVVFKSANTRHIKVATLTETQAIVCAQNDDTSNRGEATILDISSSTITVGSTIVFASPNVEPKAIAVLASTRVVVGFIATSTDESNVCMIDISSGTMTAQEAVPLWTPCMTSMGGTALSSTKCVFCFDDDTDDDFIGCVVSVKDDSLIAGRVAVLSEGAGTSCYSAIATYSDEKAVVAFTDVQSSYYGSAIVLEFE